MKLYTLLSVLLVSAYAKELFMGDNSELTARITDKTKTTTLTPAEIKNEAAEKNILGLLEAAET